MKLLQQTASLKIASAEDFSQNSLNSDDLGGADGMFLEELGVVIVRADPPELKALTGAASETAGGDILAIEPERILYATDTEEWTTSLSGPLIQDLSLNQRSYAHGYRDAMRSNVEMLDRLLGADKAAELGSMDTASSDERDLTWGLQVTRSAISRYTGIGVRVAVLDTGIDLQHPDFLGRVAASESFITGESVQDGRGHGTHCAGTLCGPARASRLPRYGVAPGAELYVGKVLGDSGRGSDGTLLAGLRWAVRQGCAIVSMSLEKGVLPNEPFSPVFEDVAQRALKVGTLIVAAAGNKSQRPFAIRPVSHPANCPSIVAVAALDPNLQVAPFSNASLQQAGGQVDFAAPGVNVLSSWPQPRLYHTLHGTSMATPHVAGIAALWAEARRVKGRVLLDLLIGSARQLPLQRSDVGFGLVQAP